MVNPVESNYSQYLNFTAGSLPERTPASKNPQSQFPPEIEGVTNKENPASGTIRKGPRGKECQTCKRRKYVDGSNDPSVSFKTPTSLSPGTEGLAVASHESQHVANEKGKAMRNGREVLYQTVQIYTAVCPECGRVYVAGGKTTTVTREKPEPQTALGRNLDLKA